MNEALETWRRKLAELRKEEALATDPEVKFAVRERINTAEAKIIELESAETEGKASSETASDSIEPLVDISHIARYAPSELIGREDETALLEKTFNQMKRGTKTRPRVLTFVALGGEGKTALVTDWVVALTQKAATGCDRVFAWSFYSQGSRDQVAVSSDQFLATAIRFFAENNEERKFADSSAGASEKGERLAGMIGRRRSLLILDGLEPLQYPDGEPHDGRLKEGNGIYELLSRLAMNPGQGLCVVTTRYSIPDLKAWVGKSVLEHPLLRLSREAGVALLQSIGVEGTLQRPEPSGENPDGLNDFEALVEDVDGHALTLQILGQYLKRVHRGDIRRRDRIDFAKASKRIAGGPGFHSDHAFRAISAYEAWLANDSDESKRELAVLRLLGLFDRPASAGCVQALRAAPAIDGLTDPLVDLPEEDWEFTLTTLSEARLVTVNRDEVTGELFSLDAHPLIREYFAQQLRSMAPRPVIEASSEDENGPEAHATSEVWRAAHRRLYEHLCETTNEGDQPTLEELQPLYQAVVHGCHAGLQQETCDGVYHKRIYRGGENYVANKLGAFGSEVGAVACFFETPWKRMSSSLSEQAQGWLLAVAAFGLRGVGRLTEAIEPMKAGIPIKVGREDWKNAATNASNLSDLELTLGKMSDSLSDAECSVTYADRSGDAFQRMARRAVHADALHQSGRRSEAESLYREAEQMQAEDQPEYPLLYSVRGFQYCDLLLAPAERAAWRVLLESSLQAPERSSERLKPALQQCREVTNRATQTLRIAEDNNLSLLNIALDHLTLSRAALYESLLSGAEISASESSDSNLATRIEDAVSSLRRAGQQQFLPLGLLTRAWYRSLLGRNTGADSAQGDLDEAWEIAFRGPMPLFLADIHLHRARLFGFGSEEYPWTSPEHDLAEARRLIEKHGYGRRIEELEDAESALLGKQET